VLSADDLSWLPLCTFKSQQRKFLFWDLGLQWLESSSAMTWSGSKKAWKQTFQ
jgi:hypothetical protein